MNEIVHDGDKVFSVRLQCKILLRILFYCALIACRTGVPLLVTCEANGWEDTADTEVCPARRPAR